MNSTEGVTDIVMMPLRFTDHVVDMRDFLTLLGFSPRVSRAASWVDLVGGSGMVAVHSAATSDSGAASGDTGLSFEVGDVDVLAARLIAGGYADVEVYDEAYGRVLLVRDGTGGQLSFNERSRDLYGYHVVDPQPQHGIIAMPLWFDSPVGPFAHLLAAAGFDRLDEGDDEWWRVWRSPGGGLIAIHPSVDERVPRSTQLGFRTRERLADLAERLSAAGHSDVTLSSEFGGELTVLDPDGQKVMIQIQSAPDTP